MNAIRRLRAFPVLVLAAAAAAQDDSEENRALRERLAAAEQRIEKLEQDSATKDRAALETAVSDYLATARPESPDAAPLAGYGSVPFRNGCGCTTTDAMGFYVRDESGDFLLRLSGLAQIRYVLNDQDDSLGDPTLSGFEIPRAQLVASGNVFGRQWTYKLQGTFDVDGGFRLDDAWITYYVSDWSFTAGQFRCPAIREEIVDSGYQLLVERSVVNDALTSGEPFQGVAMAYFRETWRLQGAFTDGDGTANTPVLIGDTDYALTFRGELLLKGTFDLFGDFTSFRGESPGIMLAMSAHTQGGETGTPGQGADVWLLSFDASFEFGGANLFFTGIFEQVDDGGVAGTRTPFGFVAQGGYFVTDRLEIVARYEFADLDPLVPPDKINVATIGANWYFHRHRVKLTGDFGYAFDAVPVTQKYTDYRRDVPFASGQIVLRIQLQLLF